MVEISDDDMQERLDTVRPYVVVLLKKGAAYTPPDDRPPEQQRIVIEHGRRNMALQAEGKLSIVGPLLSEGDFVGLYVFAVPADEVRTIMESDPAFEARIFTYELMTFFGFPGDVLPPA